MDNIKFNKLLNDKYFLMQEIARKYDYNEELLDMITFAYISFYMDFGKKCDLPLYDLFNRMKIIYESGTIHEIAAKYGFGKFPDDFVAATIFTPNFNIFKDPTSKQKPQTILLGTHVKNYLITPIYKLEMLLHEVRHALMGYYKTNILLDENTYYMRSGLQEKYYLRDENKKNSYSEKCIGMILDETTNTFITGRLVNRILSFKNYKIENNELRRYLETLTISQSDGIYITNGYNFEVKLLYPLLLNEMFIDLVNQHQFDGQIKIVKEFMENTSSICNYVQFCKLLDTISNNNLKYPEEAKNNNVEFVHEHINNISQAKEIITDINKKLIK